MSRNTTKFLEELAKLYPKKIDLSLDRVYALLKKLGNPHLRLPPVIHIAGTNGKGSTLAYLQAIYQAAGFKVHKYTSPHLVRFNERIVLSGEEIEETYLEEVLQKVLELNDSAPLTFFEATTCAAFLAFANTPADIVLLETGLGGRLDATNVVPEPMQTLISSISMDHQDFLGRTLPKIAFEKAGIMKKNVACIYSKQSEDVLEVLEKHAESINALLYPAGIVKDIKEDSQHWALSWKGKSYVFAKPSLAGSHQMLNAALAVSACLQQKKFQLDISHINAGLRKVRWQARLQHLPSEKLEPSLGGKEVLLDGGHNAEAGQVLANFLRETPGKQTVVILGMMANKTVKDFVQPWASYGHKIITVPIAGEDGAYSAESLAKECQEVHNNVQVAESLEQALVITGAEIPCDRLLVTGSLYLCGNVLNLIEDGGGKKD